MKAGINLRRPKARVAAAGASVLVAIGSLACVAPARAVVQAPRIVALLNAQRAANRIPGDVRERADWSSACAAHNRYMTSTGYFGPDEDPSSPYYSPEGAFAGQNSVLAQGSPQGPDWEHGNPFENAPIHLSQLLSPGLLEMGADDDGVHVCATTFPGYTRSPSATPTVFTYPGRGATFPVQERAIESPFVPGDFVGLPEGSVTGPYIQAFLYGYRNPTARVTEAKLTGPRGPIEVRTADQTSHGVIDGTSYTLGTYLPGPMAFIIPKQPLAPGSYHARVVFSDGGTPVAHSWTFTAASDVGSSAASLDFGKGRIKGPKLLFELDADPALVGAKATITITRSSHASGRAQRVITLEAKQTIKTQKPEPGERVKVRAEVQTPHIVATARYVGK
jgi:hypothetical protein